MPILFKHSLPSYTWLQVTFSLILTHALTLFILSIQTWLFSPPFLPLFMITAKKAVNKALRLQVRILLYSYFILGLPFFFLSLSLSLYHLACGPLASPTCLELGVTLKKEEQEIRKYLIKTKKR